MRVQKQTERRRFTIFIETRLHTTLSYPSTIYENVRQMKKYSVDRYRPGVLRTFIPVRRRFIYGEFVSATTAKISARQHSKSRRSVFQ